MACLNILWHWQGFLTDNTAVCWVVIDHSYEYPWGEVTKVTNIENEVGLRIDLLIILTEKGHGGIILTEKGHGGSLDWKQG